MLLSGVIIGRFGWFFIWFFGLTVNLFWGCYYISSAATCKLQPIKRIQQRLLAWENVDFGSGQLQIGLTEIHPILWFFQQDNVCPHIARISMNGFEKTNVNLLPWPPWSPAWRQVSWGTIPQEWLDYLLVCHKEWWSVKGLIHQLYKF